MSIRRVRALTSGATNYYNSSTAGVSSAPVLPVVARSDSLNGSIIAEPLVAPVSPVRLSSEELQFSSHSNDVGILPARIGRDVPSPVPTRVTVPVGVAVESQQFSPPRRDRLAVDLPNLPTRPAWPPVDSPKSPVKRLASARALAEEAALYTQPTAEPRETRTKRILSTLQRSLGTTVVDAIVRECGYYDHNHPGVVQLDVLARSLVRLVPGVTTADVQHVMQAVGLPDVTQVHLKHSAKSYAARVAAEGGRSTAPPRGDKGRDDKLSQVR